MKFMGGYLIKRPIFSPVYYSAWDRIQGLKLDIMYSTTEVYESQFHSLFMLPFYTH